MLPHAILLSYMLIGQFTHEIDTKKRVILPSKWRKSLGSEVIITTGLDMSLFVYTVKEWEKIAEKLGEMSFGNQDARHFNRFMLSNAFLTDVDTQGRILIPETLKTYAHIQEKIVFVGVHSRVEMWSEDLWKTYQEKNLADVDTIASKLNSIGVL